MSDTNLTAAPFQIGLNLSGGLLVGSSTINAMNAPFVFKLTLDATLTQFYTTGADIWGSRIGELLWKLEESNEAFRRPTLSRGGVLQMTRIGERVVVFSSGGIDAMAPVDLYWRYEHLSDHGLLSSWAFTEGKKDECWFIDTRRHLMRLTPEGPRDLNCSMWFTEPDYVLSWDHEWNLLYISGRNDGFVYSPAENSLGRGMAGITGAVPGGLIVGHGTLQPNPFEIHTNWYDFGTRTYKTIRSVEFSVDTAKFLEASLDFRDANGKEFKSFPWTRVNPSGVAYMQCYGLEFRFKLRSNIPQQIHLDNIRVMGTIHGYDFLNAIGWAPNANPGM